MGTRLVANRFLAHDCYDLTCTLKKSFDIVSDADAEGLLWMVMLGVLVMGAVPPFLPRLLRRRR